MAKILQEWFLHRLGIIVDTTPDVFGQSCRDGRLLAQMLYSYNIINITQLELIKPVEMSSVDAYENLKQIKEWFTLINISCEDKVLREVAEANGIAAVKLFFEFFLAINDQSKLKYLTQQRTDEKCHPSETRFEVERVPEIKPVAPEEPDCPLVQPLIDKRNIIDWHRDRYSALKERYQQIRAQYLKYLDNVYNGKITCYPSKSMSEPIRDYKDSKAFLYIEEREDLPYEELLAEEYHARNLEACQEDAKAARKFVKSLQKKRKLEDSENVLKRELQNMILSELWGTIIAEEQKEFNRLMAEKLLRQSDYEKQMASQLLEIRYQKNVFIGNRLKVQACMKEARDREFLDQIYLLAQKKCDEKSGYYFERERALALHQKLYAEKKKLKYERDYDACHGIVSDLADVAMLQSEYKKAFNVMPSKRQMQEWNDLFCNQQPIIELIEDKTKLVEEEENLDDEAEEIKHLEIIRQEAVDRQNFHDYLENNWPWILEELLDAGYDNDMSALKAGLNVLGFAVHKVLEAKYPRPPLPPRPEFPATECRVCMNGVTDLTIIPILQKILSLRAIKIVEMQEAINYCMEAYKTETTREYVDVKLMEGTEALKKDKKPKRKGKKGEKKKESKASKSKKGKKSKTSSKISAITEKKADKEIQTPIKFPCEEIVLSEKADLGRQAFELLQLGGSVSDELLILMLVQYLKSLTDYKGWALINYPTNYEQAMLLETALTGQPIPAVIAKENVPEINKVKSQTLQEHLESNHLDLEENSTIIVQKCVSDTNANENNETAMKVNTSCQVTDSLRCVDDYCDLVYRDLEEYDIKDRNFHLRKSRIVPHPNSPPEEEYYETFLTAYINILPRPPYLNMDINLEPLEDNASELTKFYADQGCNYVLYYETFDLDTIKQLSKLIIGDFSIPPKPSLTLFGDVILFVEASLNPKGKGGKPVKGMKKGDKKVKKKPSSPKAEKVESPKQEDEDKSKGKKKKKGGKDKDSKKSKKSKKGKKKEEPPPPPPPPPVEVEEVPQVEEPVIEVEPEPEPKPGEAKWKYITEKVSQPVDIQVVLGTLWENCEEVYVSDFCELMFLKRTLLNTVVPYVTYITNYMKKFIERADNKQDILNTFQNAFNEIDEDIRSDEELKAELHCRVAELRDILCEICDSRKAEAEAERVRIIEENWFSCQICELVNLYVSCMQLEIDRNVDSMMFLSDYYASIVTQLPTTDLEFSKTILQTMTRMNAVKSNKSVVQAKSLHAVQERNEVFEYFKDPDVEAIDSRFHHFLETVHGTAKNVAHHSEEMALQVHKKMEDALSAKATVTKKGKERSRSKEKKSKGGSSKGGVLKVQEPDVKVREVGHVLLEEWQAAITGEKLRATQRLNVLKAMCLSDLNVLFKSGEQLFHTLYDEIKDRYTKEVNSVFTACDVFCRAIEAEIQIQPQMILPDANFFIQPEVLLFPDPIPEPDPPITEKLKEGKFTIAQLTNLANILRRMAPHGSMPERTFTYLLQDIITNNAEDGAPEMVPLLWKDLKPGQVSEVVHKLFEANEYIDWRDFIVLNLYATPTETELVLTRQQFRAHDPDATETVTSYQYNEIVCWFEQYFDCPQEKLRNNLMKQLLYEIYKTDENTFNYTAFLLAFCRDADPSCGFAKALELSLGQYVCWEEEMGQNFVQERRYQRFQEEQAELARQQLHEEAIETSNLVMDKAIDATVHQCDSVVIEDYESAIEVEEVNMETLSALLQNCVDEAKITEETVTPDPRPGENEKEHFQDQQKTMQCTCEIAEESGKVEILEECSDVDFKGMQIDGNLVYFLPSEVLLTVMTAALPWHARTQNVDNKSFRQMFESLYDEMRNPEFENKVLVHEFIHCEKFQQILNASAKFSEKHPAIVVKYFVMLNNP